MSAHYTGLVARFPRGAYIARTTGESPETFPDFARLFSACVAAAYGLCGSVLDADIRHALEWMETNPPVALRVPTDAAEMTTRPVMHFLRNETMSIELSHVGYGYAIGGDVAWGWEDVPPEVSDALKRIASEVPYLGDSDSTVALSWEDIEPMYLLMDDDDGVWGRSNGRIMTTHAVVAGRLRELEERYALRTDMKAVSNRGPLKGTPQEKRRKAMDFNRDMRRNVEAFTYAEVVSEPDPLHETAPWNRAVWIGLKTPPMPNEHVRIASQVHRALVKVADTRLGGTPSALTGNYAEGEERLPNNVAIQVIPEGLPVEHRHGNCAGILVLIPTGLDPEDAATVVSAAMQYRTSKVDSPEEVDPLTWWKPVEFGMTRTWQTYPLAISEVPFAPVRAAALKSVKYAFKGTPVPRSTVIASQRADATDLLECYVHKVGYLAKTDDKGNKFFVPKVNGAFTAQLDLTDILPDTAVAAIGQSRHFAGGLLVPVDN